MTSLKHIVSSYFPYKDDLELDCQNTQVKWNLFGKDYLIDSNLFSQICADIRGESFMLSLHQSYGSFANCPDESYLIASIKHTHTHIADQINTKNREAIDNYTKQCDLQEGWDRYNRAQIDLPQLKEQTYEKMKRFNNLLRDKKEVVLNLRYKLQEIAVLMSKLNKQYRNETDSFPPELAKQALSFMERRQTFLVELTSNNAEHKGPTPPILNEKVKNRFGDLISDSSIKKFQEEREIFNFKMRALEQEKQEAQQNIKEIESQLQKIEGLTPYNIPDLDDYEPLHNNFEPEVLLNVHTRAEDARKQLEWTESIEKPRATKPQDIKKPETLEVPQTRVKLHEVSLVSDYDAWLDSLKDPKNHVPVLSLNNKRGFLRRILGITCITGLCLYAMHHYYLYSWSWISLNFYNPSPALVGLTCIHIIFAGIALGVTTTMIRQASRASYLDNLVQKVQRIALKKSKGDFLKTQSHTNFTEIAQSLPEPSAPLLHMEETYSNTIPSALPVAHATPIERSNSPTQEKHSIR